MKGQHAQSKVIWSVVLTFCVVIVMIAISKIIDLTTSPADPTEHRKQTKDASSNKNLAKNPAASELVMEYIYNAPESENDQRYRYHWEILKTALDKTKAKYGAYKLTQATFMTEKRQLFELKNSTKELNVMCLSTTPQLETDLMPIRIPVDKNLSSYFVLLVHKDNSAKINSIKTIEDLKKVNIGLGYGWIDVDILKANSFSITSGSNYEGLFKMVANKRFDAFSRSAAEVLDEVKIHKEILKDVEIEDSLLLYYPLPMYFWFAKNEAGKKLAERAHEGMEMMLNDGTFDRIFYAFHENKTKQLHLKQRRLFKIKNPYLGNETAFEDKRLWYDPLNDQ
jgi:hypothetical protein